MSWFHFTKQERLKRNRDLRADRNEPPLVNMRGFDVAIRASALIFQLLGIDGKSTDSEQNSRKDMDAANTSSIVKREQRHARPRSRRRSVASAWRRASRAKELITRTASSFA